MGQTEYAKRHLDTTPNLPRERYYNRSGNGFPDISAQGLGFTVITDGFEMKDVDGTSAACPTAAGIFATLNHHRMLNANTTLGFLNPLIYSIRGIDFFAFNDVTEGTNTWWGDDDGGFPASTGWDPASGMGTPNYRRLLSIVQNMP